MKAALESLVANLEKLPANDRTFAESLIAAARSMRGASAKQAQWIETLAQRATQPPTPTVALGRGIKGVVELLDHAAAHLKFPKLLVRAGEESLRLTLAGERARVPGSVNVTATGHDAEGGRAFYGRILRSGEFQPSPRLAPDTATAIAAALRAIAANPQKAAAEYGHVTGVCCFCGIPLTNKRSVAVGYGPICAENFGLPYGESDTVD